MPVLSQWYTCANCVPRRRLPIVIVVGKNVSIAREPIFTGLCRVHDRKRATNGEMWVDGDIYETSIV
jgi:hypothetical protein